MNFTENFTCYFKLIFSVKNSVKSQQYKAFTLAEVLITLGIIGVVAALTIPALITNYQKTQYSVSAKKAYTQMNQVLQQLAVNNGTIESIADYFGSSTDAGQAIASKYKVVKTCPPSQQDEECFAKFDNNYDGSANSTSIWNGARTYYKFITADGMSFAVYSYDDNCTQNKGFAAAPDAPPTNSTCGLVFIDVNGKKKPNYLGRDVFEFFITSNRTPILYPSRGFYFSNSNTGNITTGGSDWWNYSNSNRCGAGSKDGWYCTGRLMEKSWEMDY